MAMPAPPSNGASGPTWFRYDRSWEFAIAPDELWQTITETSEFPRWWPWLRSFEAVPLEPGERTRCVIGPPLPYTLDITLEIEAVEPQRSVDVTVAGDLAGPARLEIAAVDGATGTVARLSWNVEVQRPLLRVAARVARPVLLWGHDWVVSSGVAQFRRSAIRARD